MISLKESWRVQQKQRQYEILQRQQQVHQTLAQFQQARQVKATALREELRLFQLDLQLDTQEFLAQAHSQRQTQAEELMQQLYCFTQSLRQQTAQLIAINAADRMAKTQQLTQNLSEFHADLSLSVTLLRQELQQHIQDLRIEVASICAEAQELIQACEKERIQNRIQQIQTLTIWTEVLQTDVQNYLVELSLMRQDRANQVQQILKWERDRRHAEVSELFQQLAEFRSELKTYCAELHQTVWGEDVSASLELQHSNRNGAVSNRSANPEILNSRTVAKRSVDLSRSQQSGKTALPKHNGQASNGQASNKAAKQPAKRPSAVKRSPAPASSKPKASTEPLRVSTPPALAPQTSPVTAAPPSTPHPLPDPVEQRVYVHLQQTHGARLTEIEVALEINRFQAVDALRSLIKKGLVTQRDRMYLIQEDLSL